MIAFTVPGLPVPKQSFRLGKRGGYTPQRIADWQNLVRGEAVCAMIGTEQLSGELSVSIDFYLPDRRRRDLDNLSKAVLDACNGIVWDDDQQIVVLRLSKSYTSPEYGITVIAMEASTRDA